MEQKRLDEIRAQVESAKEVGLTGWHVAASAYDHYCQDIPDLLAEVERLCRIAEQRFTYIRSLGSEVEQGYDIFLEQENHLSQIETERRRILAELERLRKERDAAVADLNSNNVCCTCKYHDGKGRLVGECFQPKGNPHDCAAFEWRGMPDGEG